MTTDQDKLACIEREIGMRRRVYPRRVAAGKMSQAKADREIAVMGAIAEDYRKTTDLFERAPTNRRKPVMPVSRRVKAPQASAR